MLVCLSDSSSFRSTFFYKHLQHFAVVFTVPADSTVFQKCFPSSPTKDSQPSSYLLVPHAWGQFY